MPRSFRELIVWQKAFDFVKKIYCATENFPRSEEFALKSQIRRAAVSLPSNIAEGSARSTRRDYASFLSIALGSAAELETQILLAGEFKYISQNDAEKMLADLSEVAKMLFVIRKKLLNPAT
jgi:four helix bundle protein